MVNQEPAGHARARRPQKICTQSGSRRFLRDAAAKGYDVLITKDANQLHNPDEIDAVKRSKMHHVRFAQPRDGLLGIGLAMGAVVAAMPLIIVDLDAADSQILVQIKGLSPDRKSTLWQSEASTSL